MSADEQLCVVWTTVDNESAAGRIAETLVAEHRVACATILPGVQSIYVWKGQVERSTEWLMMLKTRVDCVEPLKARIVELHPYDLPEVVVCPVVEGHKPYMDWVRGQCKPTSL